MKHFKGVIILFTISVILSLIYNFFSSSGIALVGSWDKTQGVISANIKTSVVERGREINSLIEMVEIVEENKTLIIDVRSEKAFKKGHILHAKSFPLSEFDELIGNLYETVAMEQKIIAYCSSRECTDSHTFAKKLSELGYQSVKIFAGGYAEWEQGGHRVE